MRSRFPGFATVRVACSRCGWFRLLGYVGSNGIIRAYIRLAPDPAPCNVVWSRVIELPLGIEPKKPARSTDNYQDLAETWHWRRPHAELAKELRMKKPLVQGRTCPRCKQVGGVRLDVYFDQELGQDCGIMVMCEPDDAE